MTGKKQMEGIDKSLRIRLQEHKKFDCDLYRYAAARFVSQFSQFQANPPRGSSSSGNNEVIITPLDFADSNQIVVIDESTFLREKIQTLRIAAEVK